MDDARPIYADQEPRAAPVDLPARRLFFAISPPSYIREKLTELQDGPRRFAWVPEEKFHLTLRFFGAVETEIADRIIDAAREIRAKPFLLHLEGVGVFPSEKRPQALWAGLGKAHPHLFGLQKQLEDVAVNLGFDVSGPRFTPHITVARCRKEASESVRQWLKRHGDFGSAPFAVDAFTLYRSRTLPGGAVYQPVETFPLEDE